VLLIAPESGTYGVGRSKIKNIEKMVEYRESAEPEYPGIHVASYKDVVERAMPGRQLRRLGLVGYSVMTLPVYTSLQHDLPGVELMKEDDTLVDLRIIKSDNDIALMKKAFAVSEKAIDTILAEIKPGMTELQVMGIAQRKIYRRAENLIRFHRRGRQRKEKAPEDRVIKTATSGFGFPRKRKTDPFRGPWKHPALKAGLDLTLEALGCTVYVGQMLKKEILEGDSFARLGGE
jgi:hypothetical protein